MKDQFYISKSGEVRWNKFPEEPKLKDYFNKTYNLEDKWKQDNQYYQQALQAAKDSSIVCADQDAAWRMVFPQPEMQVMSNFKFDPKEDWVSYREGNQHWGQSEKSDSLHPFPSEQYEVEVINQYYEKNNYLGWCRRVAVITPKKEPEKKTDYDKAVEQCTYPKCGCGQFFDCNQKMAKSEPVLNEGKGWLKAFKDYLDNTPPEELKKTMAEIDAMGFKGPTVEEYFDGLSGSPRKIADLESQISNLEKIQLENETEIAGWFAHCCELNEKIEKLESQISTSLPLK